MAINAYEIQALSEAETEMIDKSEALIDKQIQAEYDADPTQKVFNVDRKNLNTEIGGLSAKLRKELFSRYSKSGWKVDDDADNYIFTMKSRRGRKPKGETVEVVEPVEAA